MSARASPVLHEFHEREKALSLERELKFRERCPPRLIGNIPGLLVR
jgi:hypothetical protein